MLNYIWEKVSYWARELGADDWELYYVDSAETVLELPSGEDYSVQKGAAFRCTRAGKTGTAYTENFNSEALEQMVRSAIDNSQVVEQGVEIYCSSQEYPRVPQGDERIEDIRAVRALHTRVNKEIAKYKVLSQTKGRLVANSSTRSILNSKGLHVSHKGNYAFCHMQVTAERAGKLNTANIYGGGSRLDQIDPEKLVKRGYDKAANYFDAKKVPSGNYRILLPQDTASLIIQGLSVFFSAKLVLNGSPVFAGKLGKRVASEAVSISNDPFDEMGVYCAPFDSKGVPTRLQPLVESGILTGFLHSAATSAGMDVELTSNEERFQYNYPADIYPSNFKLHGGKKDFAELLSELGDGLYVTELSAYFPGHGINPITGDYSIPARGFAIRDGKVGSAIADFSIAGNLYEFLGSISALGNDFEYGLPSSFYKGGPTWYGCYGSPSLIVNNISVSGVSPDG